VGLSIGPKTEKCSQTWLPGKYGLGVFDVAGVGREIRYLFFTHVYRVCHLPAVGYKRLDNDVATDQVFACHKMANFTNKLGEYNAQD